MCGFLIRLGGLIIVLDLVYLVVREVYADGVDNTLFRTALKFGGACIGGGLLLWIASRATARLAGRTCPRCSRRVARGLTYCDDHRSEAINQYRERESGR